MVSLGVQRFPHAGKSWVFGDRATLHPSLAEATFGPTRETLTELGASDVQPCGAQTSRVEMSLIVPVQVRRAMQIGSWSR